VLLQGVVVPAADALFPDDVRRRRFGRTKRYVSPLMEIIVNIFIILNNKTTLPVVRHIFLIYACLRVDKPGFNYCEALFSSSLAA
jgi:hypothetical protein